MSDADALLAAIWANPHDDLPRLVYADFIEERGEAERAEFIRLQIAIAVAEGTGADVALSDYERERELAGGLGRAWRAGWPAARRGTGFERGFPVRTWPDDVTARSFARREASRRPAPLLEVLLFLQSWDELGDVLAAPLSPWVGDLELAGATEPMPWLPAHAVRLAAGRDRLANLTGLTLSASATPAGLVALYKRFDPPHFRKLGLPPYTGGQDTLVRIADTPAGARVTTLALGAAWLDSFARLSAGAFPRLVRLELTDTPREPLTAGQVAAALAAPAAGGVRDVAVLSRRSPTEPRYGSLGRPGDDTAIALAAPRQPALRRLVLGNCNLSGAGLRTIAESLTLAGLVELTLFGLGHVLTEPGIAALRERFGPRLRASA